MGGFLVPFAVSTGLNLITSLFGSKSKTVKAQEPNLSMPKSDLGASIPFIYGRVRLSGNIFFPNKKDIMYKVETTTSTSGGGKGGGRGKTKTEKKSVYGTFAIHYCQCETNLVEILINGLGYSTSSEFFNSYCTYFDGTQTSPWSVISSRDDAPYKDIAYKGISYLALQDLPLEQFGNTIPQQIDIIVENKDFTKNPSLGAVVEDLCLKAGFSSGEIDTTELDPDLLEQGIIVPQSGESYRDTIGELMQYYAFTAMETKSGQIKFMYFDRTGRSGSTPVVIDPIHLLPVSDGGLGKKAFVKKVLNRDDETLPEKITLSFYNENRRYNRDEVAEYLDDFSEATVLAIDTNIATYPYLVRERLRKIIRYLYTQKRASYEFELPTSVTANLDLLTIVTLPNGENAQINQITTGNNWVTKFVAHFYSGSTSYTYTPPNDDDLGNLPVFAIPTIPDIYILDIPNIEDYPPNTLYGFATAPCSISISVDDNESFVSSVSHLKASTIGTVLTTGLPNVSGLDLVNTITVQLESGSLETISNDQFAIPNQYNLALLGKVGAGGYYSGKFIQFKTVTALGGGQYELSYLFQGNYGTDWVDSSSLPLKFFLLRSPSSSYYSVIEGNASYIGSPVSFTPIVSSVQDLGSTPVTSITSVGNAYKPVPPTNLTALEDIDGNVKFGWTFDAGISSYNNSQELITYEVEIYSGVTLVRTLLTTVTSAIYTIADITTDSTTAPFSVRIYAVSSVVGKGFPLIGSITPTVLTDVVFSSSDTTSETKVVTGNYTVTDDDDGSILVFQSAIDGTYNITFGNDLRNGFTCDVVNDKDNGSSVLVVCDTFDRYTRAYNHNLVVGSATRIKHISQGVYFSTGKNLWLYERTAVSTVSGTVLNPFRMYETASTVDSVLLTPDPNRGEVIGIKAQTGVNYATDNLTINGNGYNIEGSSTYVFNTNGERGLVYFNGIEWVWLTQTKGGSGGGGSGDMLKSIYDTDNDGIVDDSERLGGSLPSAYMLKSTYDTDNDGIVDDSEKLNNQSASYYLSRTNHTGTQSGTTITGTVPNSTNLNSQSASYYLDRTNHTGTQSGTTITGTVPNSTNLNSQSASYYLDRTNHSGTQLASTISDFSEAVDDRVSVLVVNSNSIVETYDDASNSTTLETQTLPKDINATYTLIASDRNKWLRANGTFTITVGTQSAYFECIIQNIGTGVITISGVSNAVGTRLLRRWTACHVYYNGTTWTAVGALV